jgi:hypothetical protein
MDADLSSRADDKNEGVVSVKRHQLKGISALFTLESLLLLFNDYDDDDNDC